MDLHILRFPDFENHIFSFGLYVCVCLYVCYQHNSKIYYSSNIKFGILYMYHTQMLLEIFYKDRIKTQCMQKNSNT